MQQAKRLQTQALNLPTPAACPPRKKITRVISWHANGNACCLHTHFAMALACILTPAPGIVLLLLALVAMNPVLMALVALVYVPLYLIDQGYKPVYVGAGLCLLLYIVAKCPVPK